VTIVSGFEQWKMYQLKSSMYIPSPVYLTLKAQPDRNHDHLFDFATPALDHMIQLPVLAYSEAQLVAF
jgi:hypothetical protein